MGDEYDTIRGMSSHRVASRVGRKPRLGPSLGMGTVGTGPLPMPPLSPLGAFHVSAIDGRRAGQAHNPVRKSSIEGAIGWLVGSPRTSVPVSPR